MPDSLDRATVGVQRFRDARDARADATERTGVDRVLCVLCQLHETRTPDGICQYCNNDFNEDELNHGRVGVMADEPTLAAALVEALKDLTVVEAARTAKIPMKSGGEFSYKYADIGDVVKLTRPKLAEHGIVALTPIIEHGDGLACMVTLLHSSGDRMDLGPFPFPHGRDAQATGSSVTYHRRYALVAALGMAAGDDDDGATAKPRAPSDEAPPNVKPSSSRVCVVCGEEIVGKVKKHGNGWVHDPLCEKPADDPEEEAF